MLPSKSREAVRKAVIDAALDAGGHLLDDGQEPGPEGMGVQFAVAISQAAGEAGSVRVENGETEIEAEVTCYALGPRAVRDFTEALDERLLLRLGEWLQGGSVDFSAYTETVVAESASATVTYDFTR